MSAKNKIAVGISSCLLGDEVRYDGSHKYSQCIEQTLEPLFQLQKFCPETACGMGVPRPPVQLRVIASDIRCVGRENPNLDVTEVLHHCSQQQHDWLTGLSGYILKKNSPSCGISRIKVYFDDEFQRIGTGLFAQYIKQHFPLMPLVEEDRLTHAGLREDFIQRVWKYHHWQQ